MRSDLAKCTTERERTSSYSGKTRYGGKVRIHPDPEHDYPREYGGFRSSARYRHYHPKEFTDVLNPLRGAIRKAVGRPWDKVFSEFCSVLDRRSVSGYHIWTHLMREVEVNTFMRNGVVMERARYVGIDRADGFYVHPITGILCFEPQTWRRGWRPSKKPKPISVPGMEGWIYEQIDGLWFRVRKIMVVELVPSRFLRTVTMKTVRNEVITEKRSANRKEIAWIKEELAKEMR